MTQAAQPGVNQPGSRTEAKPAEADEHVLPPVEDDAGATPPDGEEQPPAPAKKEDQEDDAARREAQKPPSDINRDKIAERFLQGRGVAKPEGEADEETPPADEGVQPKPGAAKPAAGESEDDAPPPDRLTLKVFGKDHPKTIDEIAVLADMTPEEVRENPERAIKFAQRELATTERLNDAKRIHREASSRLNAGDTDTHTDRRAPDKGRPAVGEHEDPDQPKQPAGDQTGEVNFKQLAEVLQIEDPEVAGQKLKEAFEQFTSSKVRETVSEADRSRLVSQDHGDSAAAVKDFTKDHPEVAKNSYAFSAIAAGLIDEYRDDLVTALVAEGTDQDEAEDLVRQATRDQITSAHQQRRIAGDPNVRRISKDMVEQAYGRVAKSLGIKIDSKASSEGLVETRQARKANLAPQPQRASVPQGRPEPVPKATPKSQIVAEMAAARGQRGQPASR